MIIIEDNITVIYLSWNLVKSGLLRNKREGEKIMKFCFGGMETQGQLMPKSSLCLRGIETEGAQRTHSGGQREVRSLMQHRAFGEDDKRHLQLTSHHCLYIKHPLH